MSQQQADSFLKKMKRNEEFRVAVMRIENVEAKMAFINHQGFHFTSDELKNARLAMSKTEPSSNASQ